MKKLSLCLDELAVDSFETAPENLPQRGTVPAHTGAWWCESLECTISESPTCTNTCEGETCQFATCGGTCMSECETCDYVWCQNG